MNFYEAVTTDTVIIQLFYLFTKPTRSNYYNKKNKKKTQIMSNSSSTAATGVAEVAGKSFLVKHQLLGVIHFSE